jgi:hypothetical protein
MVSRAALCGCLLFAGGFISPASAAVRILFVGNSLVFVNDIPRLVSDLARSRGHAVECDSYSPGGYSLARHAADQNLVQRIKKGGWDLVVLQEQSQLPSFSEEQVGRDVYPYAKHLCWLIRRYNPQARIVFYMTMAHKNGDPENAKAFPWLATYEGTQERINSSYEEMARQNEGLVAPVGRAWELLRRAEPSLELYGDEVHPNLTGSYLAACVLYATMFNESPEGLRHPSAISDPLAARLQKQASLAISGSR